MADLQRVLGRWEIAATAMHISRPGSSVATPTWRPTRSTVGATGLTFYDDDTTRFFEPHAAGKSPLLMVAIGMPRLGSTQEE
jgi:hypothetical protein